METTVGRSRTAGTHSRRGSSLIPDHPTRDYPLFKSTNFTNVRTSSTLVRYCAGSSFRSDTRLAHRTNFLHRDVSLRQFLRQDCHAAHTRPYRRLVPTRPRCIRMRRVEYANVSIIHNAHTHTRRGTCKATACMYVCTRCIHVAAASLHLMYTFHVAANCGEHRKDSPGKCIAGIT